MTERLYYQNSFLFNFTAEAAGVRELADGRHALVLDATAFYPTGGGQPCDTGWLELLAEENGNPAVPSDAPKLRVAEVLEDESSGEILHVVDPLPKGDSRALPSALPAAARVRGFLDVERRQDHMQQHSGQHVLSAAFRKLWDAPTLSFCLGEQLSMIELGAASLTAAQMEQAERLANQFVWEDRQVLMHEVSAEQAEKLGLPVEAPQGGSTRRLMEIRGVDLSLCGGTHVKSTGQIGNIQLRSCESTVEGTRIEFVCGARALRYARADFEALGGLSGQSLAEAGGSQPPSGKPPR
jgi:alanyl-tRNA synthetase